MSTQPVFWFAFNVFVGAKMLLTEIFKIPIGISLGVMLGILAVSIIASLALPRLNTYTDSNVEEEA